MKKALLIAAVLIASLNANGQSGQLWNKYFISGSLSVGKQVGIAQDSAAYASNCAWLEMGKDSTSRGMLLPRVLHTSSIAFPVRGLVAYVYDSTAACYYTGVKWLKLGGGGMTATTPTLQQVTDAGHITTDTINANSFFTPTGYGVAPDGRGLFNAGLRFNFATSADYEVSAIGGTDGAFNFPSNNATGAVAIRCGDTTVYANDSGIINTDGIALGKNFANADLTFTGDRYHSAAGYSMFIDSLFSCNLSSTTDNDNQSDLIIEMNQANLEYVGNYTHKETAVTASRVSASLSARFFDSVQNLNMGRSFQVFDTSNKRTTYADGEFLPIEYADNYHPYFDARSLIDKAYADSSYATIISVGGKVSLADSNKIIPGGYQSAYKGKTDSTANSVAAYTAQGLANAAQGSANNAQTTANNASSLAGTAYQYAIDSTTASVKYRDTVNRIATKQNLKDTAAAISGRIPTVARNSISATGAISYNSTTGVISGGGTGTVTSIAVSGANGIGVTGSPVTSSGTVALTLGAITPTSVAATGTVTASNLSGTNTGDQTSVTGNAGTATAANGLKTATTTVAISSATAPTNGQVLTASSTTAASWVTPTYGIGSTVTGGSNNAVPFIGPTGLLAQKASVFTYTSGGGLSVGMAGIIESSLADPTSTGGGAFNYNMGSTNAFCSGIGAVRNSAYDLWFSTGGANGGGYRWYTQATTERMTMSKTGQLGLNNTTPAASAILDIVSTTQGVLPPRMGTTQRNNITSPAEGLMVYDTDLHKLFVYEGGILGWVAGGL